MNNNKYLLHIDCSDGNIYGGILTTKETIHQDYLDLVANIPPSLDNEDEEEFNDTRYMVVLETECRNGMEDFDDLSYEQLEPEGNSILNVLMRRVDNAYAAME